MNATMDSYNQANIFLTKEDAKKLYNAGKLNGKMYRSNGQGQGGSLIPLRIKVSERGWRAEGMPRRAFYENKTHYEIDIPPDGPKKILQRKVIGTDITAVRLRKVYISLDSVIDFGD